MIDASWFDNTRIMRYFIEMEAAGKAKANVNMMEELNCFASALSYVVRQILLKERKPDG
jgi:hypothetical protein